MFFCSFYLGTLCDIMVVMLNNKKTLTSVILLFLIFALHAASPVKSVQEYTLENGLQVFLLEERADALVHIEFNCRAGFSSQTYENCGFFKLFTRLIKAANPNLDFNDVQCNADSSRFFIDISPSQLSQTLVSLSDAVFSSDFSDELLRQELNTLKKEVTDNASTMSYYINAAIDSRVFSDAPWKHDSGIYPPLFKTTTEKMARTYLKEISEYWYIPKNSAVFISGNINSEQTLTMLKNSFGRFYSNSKTPVEKPSSPRNKQRKFVFHSDEISADLTQVVVQYTMLDMEQCELMALALGYEDSLFKQTALSITQLNIPGDEYINVSAAHKKDSSRLIIQTLLQPPEPQKNSKNTKNSKNSITSLQQAELFLEKVSAIPQIVRPEEFDYAKNQSVYTLERTSNVSTSLMQNLSAFWTMRQYMAGEVLTQNSPLELEDNDFQSPTAAAFMQKKQSLRENTLTDTLAKLSAEAPFIFIIINSKDYRSNKKAYDAAGYQEINESNSSWYVQELFKHERMMHSGAGETKTKLYTASDDNSYYQKNKDLMKQYTLSNGIKISAKQNEASSTMTLLLSVTGGKYNSYDDIGFEEVMISLMAGLIQKKLFEAQQQTLITGAINVFSQTELATGQVIIEFDTEDAVAVINTISSAIIFGEIAPADADRAVSARKYKKRLENGTSEKQMYSKMLETLYKKGDFTNVFEAEKEILRDTDYKKILSAYPRLLDASRYNIIVCGNLPENLFDLLEENFSLLTKADTSEIKMPEIPEISVSKTSKDIKTKIRHTFLTDIPAEKAGPQPAVLIPTTEFLDPVIYGALAPEQGTKQAALYNAILCYISKQLPKKHSVALQLPRNNLNIASITVLNVEHTRELDAEYKTIVTKLAENIKSVTARSEVIRDIKINWTKSQMSETSSNTGTAFLMQRGTELFSDSPDPQFYLEEYNYIQTAGPKEYAEVMELFSPRAQIRVYSSDSKK